MFSLASFWTSWKYLHNHSIAEDIRNKASEIADLSRHIQDGTRQRDGALREALGVSEKFFDLCSDTMSNLRDLKDNLLSQEPPGVDPPTVQEQQKELKVLMPRISLAF